MDKEFDWLKGDRLSSIDAFSFAETEDLFGLLELAEKDKVTLFTCRVNVCDSVFAPSFAVTVKVCAVLVS